MGWGPGFSKGGESGLCPWPQEAWGTPARREGGVSILSHPILLCPVLALKTSTIGGVVRGAEAASLSRTWFPLRYSWTRAWLRGAGGKRKIQLDAFLLVVP